jgi:hypothetical protein
MLVKQEDEEEKRLIFNFYHPSTQVLSLGDTIVSPEDVLRFSKGDGGLLSLYTRGMHTLSTMLEPQRWGHA